MIFSKEPIRFSYSNASIEPDFSFTESMNDTRNWQTLCKGFTATGDEAYITLGRFSKLQETIISPQIPNQVSELDINRSAYYLIDNIQLYGVDSIEACACSTNLQKNSNLKSYINFEEINPERKLSVGSKFILSNINFDFNKTNKLSTSEYS